MVLNRLLATIVMSQTVRRKVCGSVRFFLNVRPTVCSLHRLKLKPCKFIDVFLSSQILKSKCKIKGSLCLSRFMLQ